MYDVLSLYLSGADDELSHEQCPMMKTKKTIEHDDFEP